MVEDIEKLKSKRKSGALAAGLNLLLPGIGYIYCGRIFLGICVLPFVLLLLVTYSSFGIPFVGVLFVWGVLIIDGFLAANRYNKKLDEKINAAMKTCPKCAEKILPNAKVCKHCGNNVE